jgi:predicted peptidase
MKSKHCPGVRNFMFVNLLSCMMATMVVPAFLESAWAEEWPLLPDRDAAVEIPAQEWPQRPGARTVSILVHYPDGSRSSVNAQTGLMLTLHNWGGSDCAGTADPVILAKQLNVVAIGVNYLQSGRFDSIEAPEPYDFGYLQALDALRSLWYVRQQLLDLNIPFDDGRIYCTGGSGGGNVTLMANKLAPRTFACVIDLCGMKKLSDDVAFDLPGGSPLNARWSPDLSHPGYLSIDDKEIRFVGHSLHLQQMKQLNCTAKVVMVHGADDAVCPTADAVELVQLMSAAGLDIEAHLITSADVDGTIFTSAGHSLGDRTQIVLKIAGRYLAADSPELLRRSGPSDFERKESVHYQTPGGQFIISFEHGYPTGHFEATTPAESDGDGDHQNLLTFRGSDGTQRNVHTIADWLIRRNQILDAFQHTAGRLPAAYRLLSPDVQILEEVVLRPPHVRRPLLRRKISYRSDGSARVPAFLFLPISTGAETDSTADAGHAPAPSAVNSRIPAVLCLHQTIRHGKEEPAGIQGDPTLKYALELAERGFITMAPDYPSFGEYTCRFDSQRDCSSGTMKAVFDNIRAVDVLQAMPEVDPDRIGGIGHSLGGHNAIFTALFEERLKVIVSSCGFTSMQRDDLPSWTGAVYMPRIAEVFENDPRKLPFDFHELVGSLAPRPFLAIAAAQDTDFDVTGVQEVMQSARSVYELYDTAESLQAAYPEVPHSFPESSREQAYLFLEEHLNHKAIHSEQSRQ